MKQQPKNHNLANQILARACARTLAADHRLEQLEHRQLMSTTVQALPFSLDFNSSIAGTLLDKQGRRTGFTSVQQNTLNDQYQPSLIDLDTTAGVLKLTTRGTSTHGSNTGLDNTLANALETAFNGYQRGFTIDTRLIGPLSNLSDRFEQAGIYLGPDQDNFVKLVAGKNFDGQYLSFEDEFTNATGGVSSTRNNSNAETNIGSFAAISTLDLRIVGDAQTGTVSAYYRVNSNSGAFTKVGYDITIAPEKRSAFFNAESRAGILAQHKNDIGPITATFDSFSINAGTAILTRPSVTGIQGMTGTTVNVRRDAAITAILSLANAGSLVNTSTLSGSTVKLYRSSDSAVVAATLTTASNGTQVVVTPTGLLDANTTYTLEVTSSLQDSAGAAFQPFVSSFSTGNLGGAALISDSGPVASYGATTFYFSDISATASNGYGTSVTQSIRLTNNGSAALTLASGALQFGGTNASEFSLAGSISLPATIKPGAYLDIPVAFTAAAVGIRTGTLTITTNGNVPSQIITLRGLGTAGEGGNLEPSLQRILDLYQIPDNVGDPTPDTTDIPSPPTSGDALDIQLLHKAGAGPVTIEVLANFANSISPSSRFGWYAGGQLVDRTKLITVAQQYAQMIRPITTGSTNFDPGSVDFGLYGEFPAFAGRIVASEKFYNTWETNTARQQKVRFYPLKNADGSVVPNAYVYTFEEYNVEFDQNDIVGIIRNVQPAAVGPQLGLVNLDGVPASDHLVFSRIRDIQTYDSVNGYIPNTFHDQSTLRITNSGTADLVVSNVALSNSDFTILSGGGAFTLAPGATRDIVLKFVFDQGGYGNTIRTATLTLTSNDVAEATKVVSLSGLWQSNSENSPDGTSREPTAQTVLNVFGYNVNIGVLNTHGAAVRAGEEVLSEYWNVADASLNVGVRMLAAFHQEKSNTNSHIRWYPQGDSGTGNFLFQHLASDGQTLLPRKNYSTDPAYGEFSPYSAFAWAIDSDWSIDARNTNAYNAAAFPAIDGGHAMRFYAAKDSNGVLIPNTYILIMDYVGQSYSNFDYQDNIFLLTNVKPASGPSTPLNVATTASGSGVALTWTANTEGNLAGYNVYRSTSQYGTYTKLNASTLTATSFVDTTAFVGTTYYYHVVGIDVHGTESTTPATISNTRTIDTAAPAAPSFAVGNGSTGSITLSWLDNNEPDLAGYNVYRATSVDGTYVKLNSSILSSSGYVDLSAPAAATSYYRVTAVDYSGNESTPASISAYRPAAGAVPTAPTSLIALSTTTSAVNLKWTDTSSNETGFVIERKNSSGTFVQIGTASFNTTTYTDVNLVSGTAYVYRVRALNDFGPSGYSNELTATTLQAAPIAATGLTTTALNANAVRLAWTDNSNNETGYRIERKLATASTWNALDTVGTNLTLYVDNSALAGTAYNYRVIAYNSVGDSPASNIATVTTPAADGYASVDIGGPLGAGSTTVVNAGRDYNITAGGTDIWNTADQFRFVYRSITGDFDYSAKVTDVSQADVGSMAGLMARESLDAGSRHIYMRARSAGLRANYRDTTNGVSTGVGNIPFTFPNAFVRLQRVGNVFTAYGSTDGVTWVVVQQMTMVMPQTIFFGMAASARVTTAATTTAQIRDLTDRNVVAAPARPDSLVGATNTNPTAALYWNDNATTATGYRIDRRLNGSPDWTAIANIAPNSVSYIDYTVTLGQSYVYRVVAVNSAGESATNELTLTVAGGVPTAPSGLVPTILPSGVKLDWIDASSNETNFQVERRLASGTTWTQLGVVAANVTTYTDLTAGAGQSYVYRVRALGSAGDSNYSAEANIDTPAGLTFTSTDIGGASAGSTQTVTPGSDYNVTASGTDIWNGSDQFRFVYRQVTGDFDIRVRVSSIGYTSDQSMAGLMARASLDANSRNVYIKGRADGTVRMTSRSTTSGTTTGAGTGSVVYPNGYLRLTRVGNTFASYASADGVTWTFISQITMSLPTTLYVGMAAASHVTGVTTTAQFRNLTLA